MEPKNLMSDVVDFLAMTETSNKELAVCYLSGNNLDLIKAADQYFLDKENEKFTKKPLMKPKSFSILCLSFRFLKILSG